MTVRAELASQYVSRARAGAVQAERVVEPPMHTILTRHDIFGKGAPSVHAYPKSQESA